MLAQLASKFQSSVVVGKDHLSVPGQDYSKLRKLSRKKCKTKTSKELSEDGKETSRLALRVEDKKLVRAVIADMVFSSEVKT